MMTGLENRERFQDALLDPNQDIQLWAYPSCVLASRFCSAQVLSLIMS